MGSERQEDTNTRRQEEKNSDAGATHHAERDVLEPDKVHSPHISPVREQCR